jgi:hypothetical protein
MEKNKEQRKNVLETTENDCEERTQLLKGEGESRVEKLRKKHGRGYYHKNRKMKGELTYYYYS